MMTMTNFVALILVGQDAVQAFGGGQAQPQEHCVKVHTQTLGPLKLIVVRNGQGQDFNCTQQNETYCAPGRIDRVDVWSGSGNGYWQGKIETSTNGKNGNYSQMAPTQKGAPFQAWMAFRPNGLCNSRNSIAVAGRNNPKCTTCTCQSKPGGVCALVPQGTAANQPVPGPAPAVAQPPPQAVVQAQPIPQPQPAPKPATCTKNASATTSRCRGVTCSNRSQCFNNIACGGAWGGIFGIGARPNHCC